jgi:hypothetical protein
MGAEVCGPPVVMKEKHLRVGVRQGGRMLTVKAWSFAERVGELQAGELIFSRCHCFRHRLVSSMHRPAKVGQRALGFRAR